MAFQNIIFPTLKLKHGITRSSVDPVIVSGNGVREVRRKQNRYERFVWNVPGPTLEQTDAVAIYKFLRGVNTGKDSFLFLDPLYPHFKDSPISSRSTTTWWLNLSYDGTTAGTHPVLHPDMTKLVFKKNGVVTTATFVGLDPNGMPYVNIAGSVPTDTITVSGPVYLTCRFDGTFSVRIEAMTPEVVANEESCNSVVPYVVSLGDFRIIEVFE